MFSDPFDRMPKNNETIAEMHARHEKESDVASFIAMMLVCTFLGIFVIWEMFQVLDKALM